MATVHDDWFSFIESKVFSEVKRFVSENNASVKFTSNATSHRPSEFPMMVIREIRQDEVGMDLDNATVNAVDESIQIDVYSDKATKAECEKLARQGYLAMKTLRFNNVSRGPLYQNGDIWVRSDRYSRIVGNGDSDIVTTTT